MPLEMVSENIVVNNNVGTEITQVICEGDIIVPDTKPDIKAVQKVSGKVYIEEEKASDNRVTFKGRLKTNILYTAKTGQKMLYSIMSTFNFEDFVNMEGVTKDSHICVIPNLEHIEYNLINDRKVGVKAVITVEIHAEEEKNIQIITDIYDMDNVQTKMEPISINRNVQRKKDRFFVKEDFSLPSNKDDIFQLLEDDITIINKDVKVMEDKLAVKGALLVSLVYSSDQNDNVVEVFEKEVPFSGFIELNGVSSDMIGDVMLTILDEDVQVMANEDGEARNIQVNVSIGVDAGISNNENIQLIDDVYSTEKNVVVDRQPITYPNFVAKNSAQNTLKETIIIDGQYKDVMQVQKVWGTARIDQITTQDNKVIADGVIDLQVMYIAQDDESPVNVVPVSIPFSQEIEIKGIKDDMAIKMNVAVDNISFNMLTPREVEIRVTLAIDAFVMEEKNGNVISNVEVSQEDKQCTNNIGTIVIYMVQEGDSLWKIAKKYNTTVDDIVAINEIENPDRIYMGQKILILKK